MGVEPTRQAGKWKRMPLRCCLISVDIFSQLYTFNQQCFRLLFVALPPYIPAAFVSLQNSTVDVIPNSVPVFTNYPCSFGYGISFSGYYCTHGGSIECSTYFLIFSQYLPFTQFLACGQVKHLSAAIFLGYLANLLCRFAVNSTLEANAYPLARVACLLSYFLYCASWRKHFFLCHNHINLIMCPCVFRCVRLPSIAQGLCLTRSTARLSCCRCTTFIIGAVTISYRLASIMPILISAVGFLCCDTTLAI